MAHERIVVVGASSGGVNALQALVAQLGPGFAAPVLAVQHVGSHPSILPGLLTRAGAMPASHALHGERLRTGHIYVAPPDFHMLLEGDRIHLSHGPKENHTRPAIDPLFRSAAVSRGPDVIAVLLTGSLDDGTLGVIAVAKRGGTVVVQDPADADWPSMPRSAMRYGHVDHVVALSSMGELLHRLVRAEPAAAGPVEPRDPHENEIALGNGNPMEHLKAIGESSTFTCPECHGTLWQLEAGALQRFRCHTGHAFTLRTLQHAQSGSADDALWSAFRALQEKELLLRELAAAAEGEDVQVLEQQAKEAAGHARTLRSLIEGIPAPPE